MLLTKTSVKHAPPDTKKAAAGDLVAILQLAYSGELAAALAYRGHWKSVSDIEDRRRIRQIERLTAAARLPWIDGADRRICEGYIGQQHTEVSNAVHSKCCDSSPANGARSTTWFRHTFASGLQCPSSFRDIA